MWLVDLFWNKIVKGMDTKRLAEQTVCEGITEVNDINYCGDEEKYHLLDIYYDKDNLDKKMPVIFDIHGGGWYYGDKELNKIYCSNLVKHGFIMVNISYRLVPYVTLKEQLEDVFSAMYFLEQNQEKYNLDMDNFFITGDSAGGHLASLVPNILKNEKWREKLNVKTNINVKASCLTCPVVKTSSLAKHKLSGLYFNDVFGKNYKNSELYELADFEDTFIESYPPTIFISAYNDFMKNQAKYGHKFLTDKNIETELVFFDEPLIKEHNLAHVYNIGFPLWEESLIANGKMLEFFKKRINN